MQIAKVKALHKDHRNANDHASLSNDAEKEALAEVSIESVDNINALASWLSKQNFASMSELQAVWRSCENLFASKSETASNFSMFMKKLEECAKQADLVQLSGYLASQVDTMKCFSVDVLVEPAELLALNATPKQLLASPGAGKYLEVVRVELFYDFEAAAYAATAGKDVSLEYATSGQLISIAASGVLDQVSDQRRCVNHSATHLVGVDEAVVLKMVGGEVTTGDSPLKVRLDYRIIDVLA